MCGPTGLDLVVTYTYLPRTFIISTYKMLDFKVHLLWHIQFSQGLLM